MFAAIGKNMNPTIASNTRTFPSSNLLIFYKSLEMRLDELMPEVLEMICCYLNLRNRQALGATFRRMEALAMQPCFTKTIFLRLNKIEYQPNQFGMTQSKNRAISKDIIAASGRLYQKVKIELCAELEVDWVGELLELLEARQSQIKHLAVKDHNFLQVMRLYRKYPSAFGRIETLDVRHCGTKKSNYRERQLVLPKLRKLF